MNIYKDENISVMQENKILHD